MTINPVRELLALRGSWTSVGPRGTASAVMRRTFGAVSNHFDWAAESLPIRVSDVSSANEIPADLSLRTAEQTLRIGWICTPPAPGSGGHTTFFRMVQSAEERGHHCTLFLYDKNSDDVARREQAVRTWWPQLNADIRSVSDGLTGMHAIVASSWGTAHVLAKRRPAGVNCFYFIQDFEPYFYPHGALYALAEDTYRFGFRNIALGGMVAAALEREVGIAPDVTVPFGCDTETYRLLPTSPISPQRRGVVYYAKRSADRRGYLLAKLGLEAFHKLHPEQEIHIYGDVVSGWSIPVTNHGTLDPSELNRLYNQTIASIALSFTNITLVAEEMMAAGNVPVMNDHPFSRAVLDAPGPVWVSATPQGIACGLSKAVSAEDIAAKARLVSFQERNTWQAAGTQVALAIESACWEAQPSTTGIPRF